MIALALSNFSTQMTAYSYIRTVGISKQLSRVATPKIGFYRTQTTEQFVGMSLPQNDIVTPQPAVAPTNKLSKLTKRWMTGLSLGALCTLWISAGNGPFMAGFFLASLIAQGEYYGMVRATGVEPAAKTGIVSSIICFLTAAMFPDYHELVMPLSASFLMMWLLIFNKKSASISEISTSLLGMFYVGFLPSFWVRLRAIDAIVPTKFPALLGAVGKWLHSETWSLGMIVTWWTWFSIVCADVGAYFVGKKFGKHKLSSISAAAGAASPNKTVEGFFGGMLSCTVATVVGAYLMQWPYWLFSGASYGIILSVIALVGDLTASMMKRDARMKDSGNILPGHGGLLDRYNCTVCSP
jgi:CDP-diglyceride synthetase